MNVETVGLAVSTIANHPKKHLILTDCVVVCQGKEKNIELRA